MSKCPTEQEMLSNPHQVWLPSMNAYIADDTDTLYETSIRVRFYYNEEFFVLEPLQDSVEWDAYDMHCYDTYAEAAGVLKSGLGEDGEVNTDEDAG
jgi:hypothetical protein